MATRPMAAGTVAAGSFAFAVHLLVVGSYTSRRWSRVSTQSFSSCTAANTQAVLWMQLLMVVPADGMEARAVQWSVVGSYASSFHVFTYAPVESCPPTT